MKSLLFVLLNLFLFSCQMSTVTTTNEIKKPTQIEFFAPNGSVFTWNTDKLLKIEEGEANIGYAFVDRETDKHILIHGNMFATEMSEKTSEINFFCSDGSIRKWISEEPLRFKNNRYTFVDQKTKKHISIKDNLIFTE